MRFEIVERIVCLMKDIQYDEISLLFDLLENQFSGIKKQEASEPKRKQSNKYSFGQIKKAFELKKKGKTRKQIEKLTGINVGSLSNLKWLKARMKQGK